MNKQPKNSDERPMNSHGTADEQHEKTGAFLFWFGNQNFMVLCVLRGFVAKKNLTTFAARFIYILQPYLNS